MRDGLGAPIAGVQLQSNFKFLAGSSVATDANGRYALYVGSQEASASINFLPPIGYENRFDYSMPLPGEYNVTLRRIAHVQCGIPTTVRVGQQYSVRGLATFDNGQQYSGSANFDISSDGASVKAGSNGGDMYVEGVSPGTAAVVCRYLDVRADAVAVQVVQ